jgi:uncharacterized protein YlxW (UPF0749 family)
VALAVVVGLVGFMLVTQYQARRDLEGRLAGEREADLAQLLSDLSARSDDLQTEIVDLRVRLATAATSTERDAVLLATARQELESIRILLGIVAVEGEGIEIVIGDPQETIGPEVLVDIVQELRDAGAEAIEVGGARVVASTAFTGRPGALVVDGTRIPSPIRVRAIGARSTLAEALKIPGGVEDAVGAREGATIAVVVKTTLRIAALHTLPRFTYATRS